MSEQTVSKKSTTGTQGSDSSELLFNIILPLVLLGCGGIAIWLFGSVQPAQRPPIDTSRVGRLKALTPVRVERLSSLQETGARLSLTVDGTVVPSSESRVAAEVAGKIVKKSAKCEAGQYVRKGELLMQIDRTDYELSVERLAKQRDLEYESILEIDQEIKNASRMLSMAQKDVALSRKEVDRQKSLPSGYASTAEVDNSERALLAAEQQMVNAENQIALLDKRRDRLESNERLAVINLMAAETDLKRTEIRAPIDGVIVSEEVDVNNFVNRGTTLFVIEDTRSVEVATQLRVDQLHWVLDQPTTTDPPAGQSDWRTRGYSLPETPAIVEYELAGLENESYRWQAKLLSYDGIGLDQQTRTVPVRVVVDQPQKVIGDDGQLYFNPSAPALVRGMFVQIRLLIEPKTDLVVIPSQAMQPGNRVYRFEPDESVLDTAVVVGNVTATDSSQTTSATDKPNQPDGASEETAEDSFEPQQWVAGRVMIQNQVTPIDSLTVTSENSTSQTARSADIKQWVCKVPKGSLSGGSYVVVSPLGDLAGDTIAARVEMDSQPANTAGAPSENSHDGSSSRFSAPDYSGSQTKSQRGSNTRDRTPAAKLSGLQTSSETLPEPRS